jgi:hypothetical protein
LRESGKAKHITVRFDLADLTVTFRRAAWKSHKAFGKVGLKKPKKVQRKKYHCRPAICHA